MRVVLDTNVLASGSIARDTPPNRIVRLWQADRFTLIVSMPIIEELWRVLDDAYFQRMSSPSIAARIKVSLVTDTAVVELPAETARIASHPEDDLILATAVAGAADYLVTGDRRLLALGEYQGARIVSPAEFLALLEAQA